MGQAKQRGTYTERVQQAKNRVTAANAARREAAFEEAQARRRAALDAEDAEDAERIELGEGRALVLSGGSNRRANNALISAALAAALAMR